MSPEIENRGVVISRLLAASIFHFDDEATLQEGIAEALNSAQISFEREVELGPGDRIDFMAGDVGIEVKIEGSYSNVSRQLLRYAQHDRVQAIVLATARTQLATQVPTTMNDKPVHVASLIRSVL